ncbi:MAG: glycoside hydrolase family 3 C-terminal domain-containing protein, partial [Cyclobacteriaceae bacterium]
LYPELVPLVDQSVHLLLMEKFKLGLFEDPYVDVDAAEKIIGKPEFQKQANLALQKSIVLLRNEAQDQSTLLPLKAKTKVYFESYRQSREQSPSNVLQPEANNWEVEFVTTPKEADVVLLWVMPKSKSLFESDGSPLYLSLSNNGVDVKYVNQLTANKPTILVINYTNPWVIDEVYDNSTTNIRGVLATFGTTYEALLDVVTGKFAPTGKMPFSTPISEELVANQKSDVPGYLEGDDYALFDFEEGLGY